MKPGNDQSTPDSPCEHETLLVIDDDPRIHSLIDFHLEGVIDRVRHAHSGREGIQIAQQESPHLILLDIDMPEMDGYAVCRQLKEIESSRDIPILFLTSDADDHHLVKALDSGGVDYLTKPFTVVVLQARVRAALRTKRLIDLLKRQARIDFLTGLGSRGAFAEALEVQRADHLRSGEPFALAILDLDFFKKINDSYGHGVGDDVLDRVGAVLRRHCRATDQAFRYGGEEFSIVLRNTEKSGAETLIDRLLDDLRKIRIPIGDREISVTCSAGIACIQRGIPASRIDMRSLLDAADEVLYAAKQQGRDRWISVDVDIEADAKAV